jgi:hypothetical protein
MRSPARRRRVAHNAEVLAILDQTHKPPERPMSSLTEMVARNPAMRQIQAANPTLAAQITEQGGFIKDNQVDALIAVNRLMLVLVRCGNGRFLCPVQDLKHFIGIIEEHAKLKEEKTGQPMQGDHIRDVSLPTQQ